MYVTPLNFNQVLERFYHQNKYDLLLLFASSFDGNDRAIIREMVNNGWRIDRITGDRICFFYFIMGSYDYMNGKLARWVIDISDRRSLYLEGVMPTMETADDICRHFAILRSDLPAFILVNKDRREEPQVFSVHDYQDFESFLTPLNILHSYIEDGESTLSRYELERRKGVVTKDDVDKRNERRKAWSVALQQLERKKTKELSLGMVEQAEKREIKILEFKRKLEEFPIIEEKGIDESIPYPHEELKHIRDIAIERLNITLNSHDGEHIIEMLQSPHRYSDAILTVWHSVRTRGVRLSRMLEKIRFEIHERGFDVFISCKSQDYGYAHELYDFLAHNGFKPFLADSSIKEVGIDQYTALIGEVINVCQYMVVFATDIRYLETPYVAAEWHTFINDINTGHKPNAKIVNILSTGINPHDLPSWLRDKQCFTTDNYKDDLIPFLSDREIEIIERYVENEEEAWHEAIHDGSTESIKSYPGRSHRGSHFGEAFERLKDFSEKYRKCESVPISFSPSTKLHSQGSRNLDDECLEQGVTIGSAIGSLSYPTGGIIGGVIGGIGGWFSAKKNKAANYDEVYSSIFAPSEVKRKSHMLVQVYLHLLEETEKVKSLAQESQKDAERRDYIPLQCKLKKGDIVDVLLNIHGETLMMSDKKSVVWQGSFTKCSFDYFVPMDIDVDELSCVALLSSNGVPVGEMRFVTKIVEAPRELNPEIIAHKYSKVFISYSHQDESKVKFLHEGLELGSVPHFFDRKYLKAGDVFPQVIQDYINSADLFILCWSENASKSEYVQKERMQALGRAFPQIKPEKDAKLRIYPMNIEPRAELPSDMKDYYHFGEI